MRLTPEHMTRLSLVRYLIMQAERQAEQPEPVCSLALLAMHDAIEMFLDVAIEALGASLKPRADFMAYWPALAAATPPLQLPNRRAMEKLNQARVALKHHGQRVTADQIRSHLENTRTFLDEACHLCYGIALSDVSASALIRNAKVRQHLEAANAALHDGRLEDAYTECAHAVAIEGSRLQRNVLGRNLGWTSIARSLSKTVPDTVRREIEKLAGQLEGQLTALSREYGLAIELVSLGVYRHDYHKFQRLTPYIYISGNDVGRSHWANKIPSSSPADARWCIDFATDIMLKLQDRPI